MLYGSNIQAVWCKRHSGVLQELLERATPI